MLESNGFAAFGIAGFSNYGHRTSGAPTDGRGGDRRRRVIITFMPIRINLLAEAQAVEDVRRRDPVKRVVWAAVFTVSLVLVWISSLQVKIMTGNSELGSLEGRLNSKTNQYNQVINNQRKLADVNAKLAALDRLLTNRFLQATPLDALQHSTVEGIQFTRMRTEQKYEVVPEGKTTTGEGGKTIPGKPGSSTERLKLILDAKDTSPNPGVYQSTRWKEALAQTPYFLSQHITADAYTPEQPFHSPNR